MSGLVIKRISNEPRPVDRPATEIFQALAGNAVAFVRFPTTDHNADGPFWRTPFG
jgi:hypothetical protein